jgi:hypothetical protein
VKRTQPGPRVRLLAFNAGMKKRLVPFALLATATLAFAEGGALDPSVAPRPTVVGERRRVTFSETLVQTLERTVQGAPGPRTLSTDEALEATWVQQVVEVGDGRVAAARVTFERWRRRDGREEDATLEGRVALIRPLVRGDGRVTLEPAAPEVSGAAAAFLGRVADRLAGSPVDRVLTPPRTVAVGEGWDVREQASALVMGAPFTEVDARRSEALATLRAVEGEQRTATVEGRLQLVTVPGSTGDRFTEGGECRLSITARWRAGERPSQGTIEERAQVAGDGRGQLPDGTPYRLKVSLKREARASEVAIP